AVFSAASPTLQYKVQWDRTDPAHKWNVAYLTGRLREFYTLSKGVARVDVRTESNAAINKTVRANGFFSESDVRLDHLLTSVVFQQNALTALLSSNSQDGSATVSFDDVCVNLSDLSENNAGACATFDKQDDTFLPPPTGSETTFPAAFPATP